MAAQFQWIACLKHLIPEPMLEGESDCFSVVLFFKFFKLAGYICSSPTILAKELFLTPNIAPRQHCYHGNMHSGKGIVDIHVSMGGKFCL